VPLLQDGDFCIGESPAIVAYLSRTYSTPERALIPESQREYAAWLEWCFFIVTELDSTSLYVMRRHGAHALGHIYGVAPEVVARAGEYFREQLRHVEVALSDNRAYLMGDRFTGADILRPRLRFGSPLPALVRRSPPSGEGGCEEREKDHPPRAWRDP
jgi:glutathione S-transferase